MKNSTDQISFKVIFICLFISYCVGAYSSENRGFNDTLITQYNFNARFSDALILIQQNKKQKITGEESALLLLMESSIHLKLGNIEVAEQLLTDSKTLISSLPFQSPNLKFHFALQKGNFFLLTGGQKEAYFYLKQAESLLKYVNDPDSKSSFYSLLGAYYFKQIQINNSIRCYEEAIRALNDHPNEKIMTHVYLSCLVKNYLNQNEQLKAQDLYSKCMDFLNSADEPLHPGLLEIYMNLTNYCLEEGINSTAEELLQKATRIVKVHYPDHHYIYGFIYHLNSRIEDIKNNYESSLRYCNNSMIIVNRYSFLDELRRINYSTLGQIYLYYKKDYEKALLYFDLALKVPSNESPANFYYHIGIAHMNLYNANQTKYNLEKVISITRKSTNYSDQYRCVLSLRALGIQAWYEKDTTQIFYNFRTALQILKKMKTEKYLTSVINYEQGRSLLRLTQEHEKALYHAQQAIISGSKSFSDTSRFANPEISNIIFNNPVANALSIKAYLLYALYEKNEKLQYLKESLRCQELSEQLFERILFKIEEEVAGLIMVDGIEKVWATNNAVSYAALLFNKTGERIYGEKALKFAEKNKMQLLQMSTQRKSIQKLFDLPDSLTKKEEWLNNEIKEIENNLILQERDDKTGMSTLLLNHLTELYDRRTQMLNDIEKNYPSYYRAKFNFNVAGVNEIQQLLNEDQVILEYQLLTTEIIIFVISQNDFYIYSQPNDSKTTQAIQSLRKLLILDPVQQEAEGSFLSFINASSYLYEKLIEPVYERIRNKRLIIIPHNELTQIPFDILISEKPEGKARSNYRNLKYLIREFPIVYAYSANLMLEKKDKKNKFGKGTAIFLPDYSNSTQGLQPLKGAAAEAAVIKKLSHGKIFRNGDASEENFKSHAGDYRILHIASHTLLDLKDPSLSCMVMTPPQDTSRDGRLYSYEISQMKLNAQLVMLSGCNTGFGLLRRSEGLISIARSFFYTGVRTIGYTLWPVADNSGYDLIQRFYIQIKKHRTLDVALRDSKLDFLETADPVKTHPYYWANYIIVGRTDRISLRKYPLSVQIAVFLVVTVFLILLFRKINRRV